MCGQMLDVCLDGGVKLGYGEFAAVLVHLPFYLFYCYSEVVLECKYI